MKYVKADVTYKMEDLEQTKTLLGDGDPCNENIWVLKTPDGKGYVLQNHAVAFFPFESWGSIIPANVIRNVSSLRESGVLTLHPEAWDSYIENKVIDENGNLLPIPKPTSKNVN